MHSINSWVLVTIVQLYTLLHGQPTCGQFGNVGKKIESLGPIKDLNTSTMEPPISLTSRLYSNQMSFPLDLPHLKGHCHA